MRRVVQEDVVVAAVYGGWVWGTYAAYDFVLLEVVQVVVLDVVLDVVFEAE